MENKNLFLSGKLYYKQGHLGEVSFKIGKIVETIAFDFMIWKGSWSTGTYLCHLLYVHQTPDVFKRVKDISRGSMHNLQVNIFIPSKANIYKKSICVLEERVLHFVSVDQRSFHWWGDVWVRFNCRQEAKGISDKKSFVQKQFRCEAIQEVVVGKWYPNVGVESPPNKTTEWNHKGLT